MFDNLDTIINNTIEDLKKVLKNVLKISSFLIISVPVISNADILPTLDANGNWGKNLENSKKDYSSPNYRKYQNQPTSLDTSGFENSQFSQITISLSNVKVKKDFGKNKMNARNVSKVINIGKEFFIDLYPSDVNTNANVPKKIYGMYVVNKGQPELWLDTEANNPVKIEIRADMLNTSYPPFRINTPNDRNGNGLEADITTFTKRSYNLRQGM